MKCFNCRKYKNPEYYHKNSNNQTGLSINCKICVIKIRKDYISRNPEKLKKWRNNYYKKNKNKLLEKSRKWYKENKKRSLELNNLWKKEKSTTDPVFKLKRNISTLVRASFKRYNYKKNTKTENILSCSIEEFKNHIKSQFLNWMNWDNHGLRKYNNYNCVWEMDHIIPISYAQTEEEVVILNHWSNFQPKCGKRNGEKGNTLYPCTNLENEEINKIIKREYEKQIEFTKE